MAKSKNSLAKYRAKRNFTKTSEPGGVLAKDKGNSYLIQKHAASHLHYDFRLELDGVLKSWAVPKGPSYDPKDKRLAMEVEDHPVAYGAFEGIIPKGQYGGGTVMLWDRGTWEPVGDPRKGLQSGKLVFKLYGERLKGEWTLVRFHGREDDKRNKWFLIKHRDEEVIEGDNGEFVQENTTSIATGRTMEEIAQQKKVGWNSNQSQNKKAALVRRASLMSRGTKTQGLPAFIEPQLATLSDAMPKGKEWIHEIKFDGYRMLAYVEDGATHMISRNNKDWTGAFEAIAQNMARLPVKNAIFDGEVVSLDAKNRSSFNALKDALSTADYSHMQYYIFDLLYLNGVDIRKLPLRERKTLLKAIIDKTPTRAKKQIFYSEAFDDKNGEFFQGVCSMHLEGVVSKRADAAYISGRSKSWLKTKCIHREEFVIGGYVKPSNGSLGVGALLLGYYESGKLLYAGKVGTGWNHNASAALRKSLDKLQTSNMAFDSVTAEGRRGAIWIKPQLVGVVEFSEWTPDGHLRHPSFEGLREDKPAMEVHRDVEAHVTQAVKEAKKEVKKKPAGAKVKIPAKNSSMVGKIAISHPDRVIFPDVPLTKKELADYYWAVSDHILPHIINRPISMLRCPEGAAQTCFYQRHVGMGKAPYLHEIEIAVKGTRRPYMMIKDVEGLISLIQWGVIEIHSWQCSTRNLDKPDRIIFDLDPDPAVKWEQMIEAANEIRTRMQEMGLTSFLKTTGGKGLHVVVPLTPAYGWDTLKSFAKAIAQSMATDNPKKYIATMSKAARKGLIFIDYLRNEMTATAVAPFSVRARTGATVSTPLSWKELNPSLKLNAFTVKTVPGRLAKQKDPWADFFNTRQKIAAKYLKALKIDF